MRDAGARALSLPAPSTSFVGRAAELDALRALFEGGAHLLTLHGPPGVGKTRLAIEAARALVARTRLAAVFVDLTSARDAAGLATSTAIALERELGGASLEAQLGRLGAAIAERERFVLILDNAEQLRDAVREAIERWRDLAPRAVFVVTSRERLALPEEHLVEVAPLPLPDAGASLTTIAKNDAVALFVERARVVRPTAPIEGEELRVVAELVRRLDALPLAIELASARTGVASPKEITEMMSRSLDVLVARGGRRSLRAAIEESWRLLSAEEAALLERFALFRGGLTLSAATALCAHDARDDTAARVRALASVEALVDKSLVHAYAPSGRPGDRRFRLLESVAELAREKLDGSGERASAERDHGRAILRATAALVRARRPSADDLAALMLEEENLLATFEHGLGSDRPLDAIRALAALARIYVKRGPGPRFLALVDRAEPALAACDATLAAEVHTWRGVVAIAVGRYADAASSLARAHALLERTGDRSALAFVIAKQALMDHFTDHPARARVRCEEALALAAEARDEDRLSVLEGVGLVWLRESETARAEPVLEAALALSRRLGDRTVEGRVLGYLGWCAFDVGRLGVARTHLELALDVLQGAGEERSRAAYLGDVGLVLAELGLFEDARARMRESLAEHERLGDRWHCAERTGSLGFLALELGLLDEARDHLRRACALHAETRDHASAALHHAGLGVCAAEIAETEQARRFFAEAERMCEGDARPPMREAIEVLKTHLALDEARRDALEGDRAAVVTRVTAIALEARARIEAHPSTEIRPALRLLAKNAEALARRLEEGAHAAAVLRVAADGSFVTVGGKRIEITRGSERRILLALAETRRRAAGTASSIDVLFSAGWGDETAGVTARTNRVRVALSSLRKLALRTVLETRPDGYRLDPSVEVELG